MTAATFEEFEVPDLFTETDRKELIKQGFQLEGIRFLMDKFEKSVKEDMGVIADSQELIHQKIRCLEDYQLILKQNIKFTGVMATVISGSVGVAVHLILEYYHK